MLSNLTSVMPVSRGRVALLGIPGKYKCIEHYESSSIQSNRFMINNHDETYRNDNRQEIRTLHIIRHIL